jgi:metal-responsive CopG/Arc/MetJ family transcriptional regulator
MARFKRDDNKTSFIHFRMDKSLDNAINEFMKTQNIDNKSKAIRELINMGILHYFITSQENS